MPSDVVISARSLTKNYRLFGHPGDRVKQFFSLGLQRYHRVFTALKDVSFDVKRGETVGIIGSNGSGKSTLLQLICGILKPTSGTVQVNGRISALLELGAGFNPEFTGRENVYFQGALMGFSRQQMDARFNDIAAFADIGEFIDQPVRTYSSGMFLRLAFAVAASADPDILIVDEALAVGDFSFRRKCYDRIKQLTDDGTTLLFVSHDLETVKAICTRAIYLDHGQRKADSGSGEVCDAYFADNINRRHGVTRKLGNTDKVVDEAQQPKLAEIVDVSLSTDESSGNEAAVPLGAAITLAIRYRVLHDLDSLTVAFHVRDDRRLDIMGSNTRIEGCDIEQPKSGDNGTVVFRFNNYLRSGEYAVSVGLAADVGGRRIFPDWAENSTSLHSTADRVWALVCIPVEVRHEKP